MDSPPPAPMLKCVIAWPDRRRLCTLVADALAERAGAANVLRLSDDSCIVYTPEEPSAIRDWLRGRLEEGESLLVLEFERWSSSGPAIDSRWLLARGH